MADPQTKQPQPSPEREHGAIAARTRCRNCDNDIETGGCRCECPGGTGFQPVSAAAPAQAQAQFTPLDDPRWSQRVPLPAEAFQAALNLAGSGTPIHHLVNIAVYGRSHSGQRLVSPGQALAAFEAALTLVVAVGHIAAEAMWQAGFPRAEIDDRITRFTAALHRASLPSDPLTTSTTAAQPASHPDHQPCPASWPEHGGLRRAGSDTLSAAVSATPDLTRPGISPPTGGPSNDAPPVSHFKAAGAAV